MTLPLLVGNWKMHGTQEQCRDLARALARGLNRRPVQAEIAVAPPYTSLEIVKRALGNSTLQLAAQNCHWEDRGAFTGEISAEMLMAIGCAFVILGHSERRHVFHESDAVVAKKLQAALRHRLRPILCVGETLVERRSGRAAAVITRQLRVALKQLGESAIKSIEIAYEPVWAIGTGQNATPEQIARVHGRIRKLLQNHLGGRKGNSVRILYGGSVNPQNSAEILRTPGVDGLLVGGASLKSETFLPIIDSLRD